MNESFYTESAFTPEKWDQLSEPSSIDRYSKTEQERRKFYLSKGIYLDESFARTLEEVTASEGRGRFLNGCCTP